MKFLHFILCFVNIGVSLAFSYGRWYGPNPNIQSNINRRYPLSRKYLEEYLRRLNGKNDTRSNTGIDDIYQRPSPNQTQQRINGLQIIINTHGYECEEDDEEKPQEEFDLSQFFQNQHSPKRAYSRETPQPAVKKSENFEVVMKSPISFKDVGG